MSRLTEPPAYVPTLTEIVQASPACEMPDREAAAPEAVAGSGITSKHDLAELQEQLVQRVLLNLDETLEKRMNAACAQIIHAHAQALVPQLRHVIESVVRESVGQALEHERQAEPAASIGQRTTSM
ncbi:MAG: hypothetical protein JWR74_67 [Polaromonas sp.]|nr:hypothetical protein [Polaromonas sp.]